MFSTGYAFFNVGGWVDGVGVGCCNDASDVKSGNYGADATNNNERGGGGLGGRDHKDL